MKKWVWIPILVWILDRAAKLAAPGLPEGGVTLIPGVLGLRYMENTGMAFSMFSGHPVLLGIVSLVVIGLVAFGLRGKKLGTVTCVGLMLMLGGALGNVADRLFQGFVPDMIEVLFMEFAIFNPADIALTVGGLTLAVALFTEKEEPADE